MGNEISNLKQHASASLCSMTSVSLQLSSNYPEQAKLVNRKIKVTIPRELFERKIVLSY